MHYEGEPNHPMPTPNYDAWNDVLRKKLKEIQDTVRQLRQLEQAYNVVTTFLREACLREDHRVSIYDNVLQVNIVMTSQSWLGDMHQLALRLGERLVREDLHLTGEPSVGTDTFCGVSRRWTWYLRSKHAQRITVVANISTTEGTLDYEVHKKIEYLPSETYTLEPRASTLDVKKMTIYDRIAAEVMFTRQQVKDIVLALGYDVDVPTMLNSLGFEVSEITLTEVARVKELMEQLHADKDLPHDQVRASDVPDMVHHEPQPEEVLHPEVPEAGERSDLRSSPTAEVGSTRAEEAP